MVQLHAVGDSMLRADLLDIDEDFGNILSDVGDLFTADDLTLMNLECPTTDLDLEAERQFALQCDPAGLAALATAGVDVLSVANDTTSDFGPEGFEDTIAHIEAAGIAVIGADTDATVIERQGQTIAVLGLTRLGDAAQDDDEMIEAVEQAREDNDVVLVSMHWGDPEDRDPNEPEVVLAQQLIDAGASAIYGHGTHRLQSLRVQDGVPVVYGLGHFVWPLNNERDPDSTVAYSEIDATGQVRTCLLPATIRTNGRPALDRPDAGCDIGSQAALGVEQ